MDSHQQGLAALEKELNGLKSILEQHPELSSVINENLSQLLLDLQTLANEGGSTKNNLIFDTGKSPAMKIIHARFGQISQISLYNLVIQLSAKSGIHINRDTLRNRDATINWIDSNITIFSPLLDQITL